MKFTTKDLAYNGIVAAIYVALTLLAMPISYGAIQFRISEMLVLLVFFNKKYTWGICLGTALANLGSTLSMWDVLFGTAATLIACVGIMFSKHLLVATIYPVLINAIVIGFEIYMLGGFGDFLMLYCVPALQVAGGELVVLVAGYLLFMLLKQRKDFGEIINGNQNLDFKW